jgi:hypothetical protein
MIRRLSNVEIVIPTALAIALAIVLSIGAIYFAEIFLGPIEQVEAHQARNPWLPCRAPAKWVGTCGETLDARWRR